MNDVTGDLDKLFRPIIKVVLVNPSTGEEIGCDALIDTGCFNSRISTEIAQKLGLIKVSNAINRYYLSEDISGEYEASICLDYVHKSQPLKFGVFDRKTDTISVIIGTQMIAENFELVLNNPKGKFSFKPLKK